MRGNLLDVMKMQYIETARAKGLSKRRILIMHAIPNALHPIIMNQGARFDYMVKGELEIAIVLGIPMIPIGSLRRCTSAAMEEAPRRVPSPPMQRKRPPLTRAFPTFLNVGVGAGPCGL